jgi:hypothetical protein
VNRCRAPRCTCTSPRSAPFCVAHLAMLYDEQRAALGRAYHPAAPRQSQRFEELATRALRAMAYYEQNGHREPRAMGFQWEA